MKPIQHHKKKTEKFYLAFILICNVLLNQSLFAQTERFEFVALDLNLSHNSIYHIFQDSAGFMWFGTQNGLNKFDGIEITVFENIPDDTNSLTDNTINKIVEGNEGELWIATNSGVSLLQKDDYSFKRYLSVGADYTSQANIISDLFKDSNNEIWGVAEFPCRYIREKDDYKIYNIDYQEPSSEPTFFFQDSQNNLWFLHHKEIFLYDSLSDSFKLAFNGASIIDNELFYYSHAVEAQDGTWYVAANYHGILPIKLVNGLPRIDSTNAILYKSEFQSMQRITELYTDTNNLLLIGAENEGLYAYSLLDGELEKYTFDPANKKSISSNSIWSICKDRQNRLWFGTYSDGVCLIDNNFSKFTHYKSGSSNKGLSYNNISDFAEDENGNIWIGTDGGGVNFFDREKNEFSYYKKDRNNRNSISSDAVLALCFDIDNNLWIGTWEGGISVLDTETGRFKCLNISNSGLSSNRVVDIVCNSKGEIYIASFNEGVDVYNPDTQQWTNYKYDSTTIGFYNNNTIKLLVDSEDNLWVCTQYGGISKFTFTDDNEVHFESFMHNSSSENSISNNSILNVLIDRDQHLWIGTPNGLNVFNYQTKSFSVLTKNDGLPSNSIQSIIDDENGDLWIGTLNGLSHLKLVDTTFVNYTSKDGLQGNIFMRNSVCRLKSGELMFGGSNGFNLFHPNAIRKNVEEPVIVFTDFKIFNKSVNIESNSPLTKHIERSDRVLLTHKQSVFTIDFVALNYTHPEKSQYAFYLEGLEKEWNYVGAQRMATYTNLDPGEYTFHVKASNNDGVWNEKGISLLITIVPPIYKRTWFRILLIILSALTVTLYYSLRIKSIKRINEELEKNVKERTNELRLKNEMLLNQSNYLNETNELLIERQEIIEKQTTKLLTQRDQLVDANAVKDKMFSIIAHDIKNPFSTLLGFSELLKNNYNKYDEEKKKRFVNFIHESSTIIYDLVTSLLYWSRAQRGDIKPVFESIDIIELIDANIELAMIQANKKKITVKNDTPFKTLEAVFDRDLINTVIRNLISNAIKFTKVAGIVTIQVLLEGDKVRVSIKDNGVGITKEKCAKIFEKGSHDTSCGTNDEKGTGLGLKICKDFIDLHKGEINVESEEGKGSVFCFSIPLKAQMSDFGDNSF